jgi:hypothetical protein
VVDVAGRIVVGHASGGSMGYQESTHTTTRERQIDAAEARNYEGTDAVHQNGMDYSVTEQVTTTTYEPVYRPQAPPPTAPKTERCNAALLPPTGAGGGVSDLLTQAFGTQPSKVARPSPGLRLAGTYAGPSGLRIEFREDSATVECGQAHVAEAYAVQDSGGQISVKIQNGATPFTLSLQPNGTLIGSGSIDVAGRVVTGSTENAITYAPRSAHCAIGTLTPK